MAAMNTCILVLLLVGVHSKIQETPRLKWSPTTRTSTPTTPFQIKWSGSSSTPSEWSSTTQAHETAHSSTGMVSSSHSSLRIGCKTVNVYGFLKCFCKYVGGPDDETLDHIPERVTNSMQHGKNRELLFQCATSSQTYRWDDNWHGMGGGLNKKITFSHMCPNDPGVYQACGVVPDNTIYKVVENSLALCGAQLCIDGVDVDKYGLCQVDKTSEACDQKCGTKICEDEAMCNGVSYGIFCYSSKSLQATGNAIRYVSAYEMCSKYGPYCDNGEDTRDCFVEEGTPGSCIKYDNWIKSSIMIRDEQRCPTPKSTYTVVTTLGGARSVCSKPMALEQTNCTDFTRLVIVGCTLEGYPTNISLYGTCKDYPLCDDNYNNLCQQVDSGCNLHKGQLCDGTNDCSSGADEAKCQTTEHFICERRFHTVYAERRPLALPMSWVMDGIVDCLDRRDEDEKNWLIGGKGSDEGQPLSRGPEMSRGWVYQNDRAM
eukprot:sb/3464216/